MAESSITSLRFTESKIGGLVGRACAGPRVASTRAPAGDHAPSAVGTAISDPIGNAKGIAAA